MRKGIARPALIAVLVVLIPRILPAADSVLLVGGASGWSASVRADGLAVVAQSSGYGAVVLDGARAAQPDDDLFLPFDAAGGAWIEDAAGRYRSVPSEGVSRSDRDRAWRGAGAAVFSGVEGGLRLEPGGASIFGSGGSIGDFSIAFWLYPANMENGEQLLSWSSSRRLPDGRTVSQAIRCIVARNRLEWTFSGFFAGNGGGEVPAVTLSSRSTIVPRRWSHLLVRFQAATGLLEFVVDGRLESSVEVRGQRSGSSASGSEPVRPEIGSPAPLVLGPRFAGIVDEFRISRSFLEKLPQERYPTDGYLRSAFFDLGSSGTRIDSVIADATVPDGAAALLLFARAGESPYGWPEDEASWVPVDADGIPEKPLLGRWVQVAARIYPDAAGVRSPVLRSIRIAYAEDAPPPPPSQLVARAENGAVELAWSNSADEDLGGYIIYFGESSGVYYGTSAAGPSPLDVGLRNSYRIDGLFNGRLYYFSVAAYDRADPAHIGALSKETNARPVRTSK